MEPPDGAGARGSRAFRAELADELPRWVEEGLVDARAAEVLRGRYALGERNVEIATAAIYVLGALLVGGGVVSFIAWNWEALPTALKLTAIGAALVGAHGSGWWLWHVRGTWPRAGHALMFLGTLVFGAAIGLVAQIYHVSATWYGGFGAWALGASVAAWALRSVPNGILAVVLATVWAGGWSDDHRTWASLAPFLVGAAFLPLAWTTRSRWLFGTTAFGVCVAAVAAATMQDRGEAAGFATMLACATALLAWPLAFGDFAADAPVGGRFSGVARTLGVLAYGYVAYVASFRRTSSWLDLSFDRVEDASIRFLVPAASAFLVAAFFVGLGARRTHDLAATVRVRAPTLAAITAAVLLLVAMTTERHAVWLAVAGNVALGVPALLLVAGSMRDLARGRFWLGTITLAALVVTRFFEYETNLGVKAAVFVGSGVAVILVGVAFERRLRAQAKEGPRAQ